MTLIKEEFFAALTASGMPEIPKDFSVVPLAQLIPHTTLVEIDNFIRLFDRVRKGNAYVAQKTVSKPTLVSEGKDGKVILWTDLRVWAYRGGRYLISGRASKQRDLIDLALPGGWLATLEESKTS